MFKISKMAMRMALLLCFLAANGAASDGRSSLTTCLKNQFARPVSVANFGLGAGGSLISMYGAACALDLLPRFVPKISDKLVWRSFTAQDACMFAGLGLVLTGLVLDSGLIDVLCARPNGIRTLKIDTYGVSHLLSTRERLDGMGQLSPHILTFVQRKAKERGFKDDQVFFYARTTLNSSLSPLPPHIEKLAQKTARRFGLCNIEFYETACDRSHAADLFRSIVGLKNQEPVIINGLKYHGTLFEACADLSLKPKMRRGCAQFLERTLLHEIEHIRDKHISKRLEKQAVEDFVDPCLVLADEMRADLAATYYSYILNRSRDALYTLFFLTESWKTQEEDSDHPTKDEHRRYRNELLRQLLTDYKNFLQRVQPTELKRFDERHLDEIHELFFRLVPPLIKAYLNEKRTGCVSFQETEQHVLFVLEGDNAFTPLMSLCPSAYWTDDVIEQEKALLAAGVDLNARAEGGFCKGMNASEIVRYGATS